MVFDPKNLESVIKSLSHIVGIFADDFLDGHSEKFKNLRAFRELETQKYTQKTKLTTARRKAEDAWHVKDFQGLIKAYKPVEEIIPQFERKRLEYAKKI